MEITAAPLALKSINISRRQAGNSSKTSASALSRRIRANRSSDQITFTSLAPASKAASATRRAKSLHSIGEFITNSCCGWRFTPVLTTNSAYLFKSLSILQAPFAIHFYFQIYTKYYNQI